MTRKLAAEIMGLEYDENIPLGTAPKKSLEAQDVTDAILYILSTPPRVQVRLNINNKYYTICI